MLIEAESIPYEPAQLRGERLLVLAPHPDDEVIGCGGLVALHLAEARPVRVVVATDGAQAGDAATREEESRRALASLGGHAQLEFLRFPDRALNDAAAEPLREHLLAFRPDLVLVPSPIEIHPDHFALARIFCELVQRGETLFADLAVTRVAFYEVGQPIRPNALVDITSVADAKYAAIAEHASQLATRDYVSYARGLNAYRAMTLPRETKFAEGYFVIDLPSLHTLPLSELRARCGTPPALETAREPLPVSVVIRTKDRPALLREAIDSVRATGYPCEIVVVNDGGAALALDGVTLVQHETSRGRSEAANAGVRAATNAFVAFLDDDDRFYPEHLQTLATAALGSSHAAWYTDAVSLFLRPAESGAYEAHARLRLFAQDFDRELLLVDNYIPLPTLLIRRDDFLAVGGFDPAFDLFEDWDFLIRLAERGDFLRVPRVTCEIRHFEGGSSVVLAAPEGSQRFRDAKRQVWAKHAARIDNDVFANVLERQKSRTGALYAEVIEAKGSADSAHIDIARLEREKQTLIAQLGESHHTINGYAQRVRELEGVTASMSFLEEIARDHEQKVLALDRATRENDALRRANAETHEALERARVEIARLNGLLETIYGSKTWRVHTLLERARGRG
ncbi:MAG: PIG-L family deacetylase [Acidobacteria bacterium]|nr:PIG-L family deacetylase [Acidobacteriota bacterium]MBV9476436.1 PIG-L family deacetylase [Acidobacteriota bacterium]